MKRNHELMGELASRRLCAKDRPGTADITARAMSFQLYYTLGYNLGLYSLRRRPTKRCCFFCHSVSRFLIPIRFVRVAVVAGHCLCWLVLLLPDRHSFSSFGPIIYRPVLSSLSYVFASVCAHGPTIMIIVGQRRNCVYLFAATPQSSLICFRVPLRCQS